MIDILGDIFSILVLYMVIALLWQFAELTFYGKITTRVLDDVIAIILAVSLFYNFIGR